MLADLYSTVVDVKEKNDDPRLIALQKQYILKKKLVLIESMHADQIYIANSPRPVNIPPMIIYSNDSMVLARSRHDWRRSMQIA